MKDEADKRMSIMERYNNYVNSTNCRASITNLPPGFYWNEAGSLPIIPALHGTDKTIAHGICSTGFAAMMTTYVPLYSTSFAVLTFL